ncbi:hypothetical protein J3R82DRAFT_7589 [Butyriboletus roseoflavus]|nr:hypothetical protein J3R82DRAFT_7589 [Butyriboletus roseoflavus]
MPRRVGRQPQLRPAHLLVERSCRLRKVSRRAEHRREVCKSASTGSKLFFSRKEILRRKAKGFFPTLACQILVFASSIKPALLDALDADATIPTKVLLEQARRLLQEPIMSSPSPFSDPVLIVVDSLDECDDVKMANEIVHLLSGILRHCRWPLKVLFTSRAEPHIVQTFQHSELRSMTRSFQLRDFDVDDDIRAYLRQSFQGLQDSESMDAMSVGDCPLPWPSDDEIEMIVQKAAGLFIFATTVVKYVGTDHGSPVTQLQAVLQVLQNSASAESALVHSPLDALYSDALSVIPDVEKVDLVLGSVVFAFRPLSTRGLSDLLWKFQFNTRYIVKNLSSVLVISDSGTENDGAVYVYHTSFRDFLTSSHRSRQYFVDPVVFHNILARACLELMIRHLTVDMCSLGDPSILNREIENLDKRCRLRIKEGVRYACRWFTHHLSHVPWDRRTDDALILYLQAFANQHLLNWIEVLSLTGELDSAVLSLREAADWLRVRMTTRCVAVPEFYCSTRQIHMKKRCHCFAMRKDWCSYVMIPSSKQRCKFTMLFPAFQCSLKSEVLMHMN